MHMRRPWFQFFPGDWLSDPKVTMLSEGAEALYIRLLCYAHQSKKRGFLLQNDAKMTPKSIQKLSKSSPKGFAKKFAELIDLGLFVLDEKTGAFYNPRMVRDSELERVRAERGRLGGNPVLVNQQVNPKDNQGDNQEVIQNGKKNAVEVNQGLTLKIEPESEPEPDRDPQKDREIDPEEPSLCLSFNENLKNDGPGMKMLVGSGLGEDTARSILKSYNEIYSPEVVSLAVAATLKKNPAGPADYLHGVLKKMKNQNPEPVPGRKENAVRAAIADGMPVYCTSVGKTFEGVVLCPGGERATLPDGRDFPISFFEVPPE